MKRPRTSGQCFVEAKIAKIYFPRIFIPLGSIGALGLDLVIGLLLVFAMMIYYRWPVVPGVLLIPVYVLGTLLAASGLGLILSALNVRIGLARTDCAKC